jgi:hypothetical protein
MYVFPPRERGGLAKPPAAQPTPGSKPLATPNQVRRGSSSDYTTFALSMPCTHTQMTCHHQLDATTHARTHAHRRHVVVNSTSCMMRCRRCARTHMLMMRCSLGPASGLGIMQLVDKQTSDYNYTFPRATAVSVRSTVESS